MSQSNCEVLGINFFESCSENVAQVEERKVHLNFIASFWYKDIIYVLQNLQAPPKLRKTKARFVRLKAIKFCNINSYLYWKDQGTILLNCLLEEEAKKKIKEFQGKDCGVHLYWKIIAHNILRVGFYWPTLFADTYKQVSTYHECQVFEGNKKLFPPPLKTISVEAPFQQ